MNKGDLSNLLRKLGLMRWTDDLRYHYFKFKNRKKNRAFLKKNPEAVLPPDYAIYEAFQLNYEEYLTKSKETAEWILGYYIKHKKSNPKTVLDWGCGPGRIIRHLPGILGKESKIYGTDYNIDSINWCKKNLQGVAFNHNTIEAALPYENDFFDFIFGISIFTHLSAEKHVEWTAELTRILKKGGRMFFTTHGRAFTGKLSKHEREQFNNGNLVVRGKVTEGHRTYSAYHPASYLNQLFTSNHLKVVEHTEQQSNNGKPQQDIWLLEKTDSV